MKKSTIFSAALCCVAALCAVGNAFAQDADAKKTSGNPLFPGWYADPEVATFDGKYWIFPTYSDHFDKQTFFDCFSSTDLVNWTKHERVLTNENVKWAKRAMWAPSVVEKDGKYYFFFGANDVHEGEIGGIGVAVADKPEGPYKDYLGKPLVNEIVNGAQPIDQFVFQDDDGTWYMIYGGWRHCNIVKLKDDFTGLVPYEDGTIYREITPKGYVEGPWVKKIDGKYYFMWSEGGWTGPHYKVAYAISDSLFGPHERIGEIISPDPKVGMGAGHHSVLQTPSGNWYAIYHRRPITETHGNHRATCIDKLEFNADGTLKPVTLTYEGVAPDPIDAK
ncbi:MAG: glycoside hydrolase family 43 protein [Thermoguttaceae bacterium]|nr:glycoside hydrolase family 43 protein [Thermoguttaceae bacterium]